MEMLLQEHEYNRIFCD